MFSPSIKISPEFGLVIPVRISNNVDFPEPFLPKIPTVSPFNISKLIFSNKTGLSLYEK